MSDEERRVILNRHLDNVHDMTVILAHYTSKEQRSIDSYSWWKVFVTMTNMLSKELEIGIVAIQSQKQ